MTRRYSRYIPLFYYLGQTPQFSKLIQNIRRLSMTNGDLESTPDPFINILHFHLQAGSFFPKGFDAPVLYIFLNYLVSLSHACGGVLVLGSWVQA